MDNKTKLDSCDIIDIIVQKGLEEEIYNILHKIIMKKYEKVREKNAEYNSTITAIKKINKGKNEAIDALCDND